MFSQFQPECIAQLCSKMTQGDQARVLKFAQELQSSRTAKRRSHERPLLDDWRIGN